MKKNKTSTDIAFIALMTAVTAITAQIIIPLPMGVPMTLQTFAVILTAIILGPYRSFLSMIIYILIGTIGIPVFAGFRGGLQCIAGPTAGFILSFPIMALVIGYGAKNIKNRFKFILCLIIGIALNYLSGCLIFSLITKSPFNAALAACVIPFLPGDIIKAICASLLGCRIRKAVPGLMEV